MPSSKSVEAHLISPPCVNVFYQISAGWDYLFVYNPHGVLTAPHPGENTNWFIMSAQKHLSPSKLKMTKTFVNSVTAEKKRYLEIIFLVSP